MTIQDVQRRIAKEEKALAMLDTRKGQLRERKDRVVAEGKWVDAQLTQTHNAVTEAKVRLKSAEVDMNLAVAKDIAKNFNSLTIDEFIAELKTAVRSKFPFEKQIVGLLEVYACYKGVPDSELENLLVYTDPNPPYRYRKLLPTQKARVVEVLERRCPKHPQTGRYLPPLYKVEDDVGAEEVVDYLRARLTP